MAGLDPAISLRDAQCPPKRDHRDKPGDDNGACCGAYDHFFSITLTLPMYFFSTSGTAIAPPSC
ncbi:hypothetical protein DXH78_17735 [Undibacter mobilis]|uniref:Uncharacterized protein n=1 Tax=Undibacter mobilis TaxID=2292256 RepID=A0A371B0T0_9BRAD|nr:hypothetical protein DXH78_17735 [Undibacter mobilis]